MSEEIPEDKLNDARAAFVYLRKTDEGEEDEDEEHPKGHLTRETFLTFCQALSQDTTEDEINAILNFDDEDADGSGDITWDEAKKSAGKIWKDPEIVDKEFKKALKDYFKNDDEEQEDVSIEVLKEFLLEKNFEDDVINKITEMDKDESGTISFDELSAFVHQSGGEGEEE